MPEAPTTSPQKTKESLVAEMLKGRFFQPKSSVFWCALVVSFIMCSFLGHWLEIPYCGAMDALFGIVDPKYAAVTDPWYVPYRIYGYGVLVMTFLLEPLRDFIVKHNRSLPSAIAITFGLTVLLAMLLEMGIGLAINQPDANGVYPFWDNSQLPGNVLGQAWIVNDFFIGLVTTVYLWVFFPLMCVIFVWLRPHELALAVILSVACFAVACMFSLPYL